MKRLTMYLAVLAICMFLFTLVGCGASSEEPKDGTDSSAISQTEDDATGTETADGEDTVNADDGATDSTDRTGDETGTETEDSAEGTPSEGDTGNDSDTGTLTDEEILEKVQPYLEDLVYQDPEVYTSFGDFLKANLNLDESDVISATLYMGAPNQNTGYFLMLTPTENADTSVITEKLEKQAEAMVHTAEQGYTQGYAEYSVLEQGGRIFLVMQPTAERYQELVGMLSELGE